MGRGGEGRGKSESNNYIPVKNVLKYIFLAKKSQIAQHSTK
jgi:hypothetical protein